MSEITESINNTWWVLPSLIDSLKESRLRYPELNQAFNTTIILHAATITEGFISQLINDNVMFISGSDRQIERIRNNFYYRTEQASWNELNQLYKILFGLDLNLETDNETWKGIMSLFSMRNLLVHSNKIVVSFYKEKVTDKNKLILTPKLEKIYKYLALEKKIIGKINLDLRYPKLNLITDESADFYWLNMVNFLQDILKNKKDGDDLVNTMFYRSFKQKNKISGHTAKHN